MSNGAAGCGAEFESFTGHRCKQLIKENDVWACNRYKTALKTACITGQPFRCQPCSDAADSSIERKLALQRKLNHLKVKGN